MAAAGAESVTAADIDQATVDHVRERYGIEAHRADVRSLPFDDGAFGLVVSFETIEHVHEPERALDELARVRAPGGHLLISTPNAAESLVQNEFHVHEFGHDEFVALLRERFPAVRLLYQHNWLTSAVLDEAGMAAADGAGRGDAGADQGARASSPAASCTCSRSAATRTWRPRRRCPASWPARTRPTCWPTAWTTPCAPRST